MRKAIAIVIVILSTAIYYCSNNPEITDNYFEYRKKITFLRSDKSQFGGLYTMCYLPEYRIPFSYANHPAKKTTKKNIDLYIMCDSYVIVPARQSHFYGLDTLIKIRWFDVPMYRNIKALKKNKHNILIIEMTERYVRDICINYDGMINLLKIDTSYRDELPENHVYEPLTFSGFVEKHFINPNINSNLELNIFDYGLFRPVKELKAEFNYRIFNRVSEDVYVDKVHNFLYYTPTMQNEQKMNVFFPLDSTELPNICRTLNKVYDYYKVNGFEEVYLSIIPNPITMVNPRLGIYNNLIPGLNAVDSLRMKLFNIYGVFAKNPQKYYARNDTHWSSEGYQTWLDEFNKILEKTSDNPLK